jgi:hypothetical protein
MESITFPEFIAQIVLEEETRIHEVEKNKKELYNHSAYESNMGRAMSMSYPVHNRVNLAKAYTYLRHRELKHGEKYEEEKEILTSQMVKSDIATIEEGVVSYGWWNS